MASLPLTLPPEYGYVLLTATLTSAVNFFHIATVASHRDAAKVPFPNAYASAADAKESRDMYLFNCAQRAHANYLEHWPAVLVGLLGGGVRYPIASACMGVAWCAARVLYTIGYTNKNQTEGKGRRLGLVFYIPEFGLQVLAGLTGYKMLL